MNHFIDNIKYLLSKQSSKAQDVSSALNLSLGLEDSILGEANHSPDDLLKISGHFGFSVDILFAKDIKKMEEVSAKNIQFLVLDVDGVMTDGGMYYTESGDEFKRFDTRDGVAIRRLTRKGFKVGIISSGFLDNLIRKRAELLGIQKIHTGHDPKLETLQSWCSEMKLEIKQVAYIGDDLNDKLIMEKVGISACPADADENIKKIASVVLANNGGMGCIREFVDLYFTDNPYIQ